MKNNKLKNIDLANTGIVYLNIQLRKYTKNLSYKDQKKKKSENHDEGIISLLML